MYKRPNAPFKPPRPMSGALKASPAIPLKDDPQLFVPETEPRDSETIGHQHLKSQQNHQHAIKRVKPSPMLVRRLIDLPKSAVHGALRSAKSSQQDFSECNEPPSPALQEQLALQKRYYTVQWRKRSTKKNKSWEGDGFVVVSDMGLALRIQMPDESYKLVSRTKNTSLDGVFRVGIYEVEIDSETTRENIFGTGNMVSSDSGQCLQPKKTSEIHQTSSIAFKNHNVELDSITSTEGLEAKEPTDVVKTADNPASISDLPSDSFILPSPRISDAKQVIVDERLTKYLRPHQREGITFLYQCLMGMRNENQYGALLADEMGLGKTLITISLIWTLLKQSPAPTEKNVINKVLVCCPVSLIENWRKEFGKWLDLNRIGILTLNNKSQSSARDKQEIVNFGKTRVYQVLIMNYEKVLACSSELSSVNVDLLVCDEGHRLKSSTNKVLKFLSSLTVQRRLVLTGTPIQNDLNEFFNIANFINPGLLGTLAEFQKEFLKPILRARDVNCYDGNIAQEGREKSASLIDITKTFTIRRTKAVIEEYLTSKTDLLVFCPPSKLQKKMLQFVIDSMGFSSLSSSGTREVLPTINLLRKICNSPSLLADDAFYKSLIEKNSNVPADITPSALTNRTTGSKINLAIPLLIQFRNEGESAVLVSNYTQTLDLMERILLKLNFLYARLDGSTPLATRDILVTAFNKAKKYDVFLLSAKAGGVGLNLIGASRLILFDNDWNPLVDLQAMARIHRDGQKKPVFIYRLFTTGSIDEKIFQRQLMKNNLSDMFMDDNVESTLNIFDYEDLRDLFTVVDSICNTHDLIDCNCLGQGDKIQIALPATREATKNHVESSQAHTQSSGWISALEYKELDQSSIVKKQTIRSALSHYRHFDPQKYHDQMDTGDAILNSIIPKAQADLTYIFTYQKQKVNTNI